MPTSAAPASTSRSTAVRARNGLSRRYAVGPPEAVESGVDEDGPPGEVVAVEGVGSTDRADRRGVDAEPWAGR